MISRAIQEISGHEKAEAVLARALINDRVFPTWIFRGPSGIGKTGVAFKFAKCLLAGITPKGDALDIAPENPIHKVVDGGVHPDLFVLRQNDESVSIDDTRKLMLKVRKTPADGGRRVVILENSSAFNKNICNSLLKILEEPPKNAVIIMICDNPGLIPKTLLSRAAKLYFNPLPEAVVKKILDAAGTENSEKSAKLSEGSVGYAFHLHENGGVEIYDTLLRGFFNDGSRGAEVLKKVVDDGMCDNFRIVKTSLLRILKIYARMIGGIADENLPEETEVLEPTVRARRNRPDKEIARVQDIVSLLCRCEPASLDKNAVVSAVFEKFFQ
ncbi:MAG: hypothetical protein LBO73_03335 [Holosporaceae bacterium]|jgi:hypothetical protein|nr:hypothetical protein [Holosporaceae bacterium]